MGRGDGPYGVTRHAIYAGILGMLLGSILVADVGRWLLLPPVGLVLFSIEIRLEDVGVSA
jgi:protein-S-isoprenylcysteine O-methyltransferase Ste14